MHLLILDCVEMDVANPVNCLFLEYKRFVIKGGLFSDFFMISGNFNGSLVPFTRQWKLCFSWISKESWWPSPTNLFKGDKSKPSVPPGLLVHQHHRVLHISLNCIFKIDVNRRVLTLKKECFTCIMVFSSISPNWRKYSRTSSVAVSWLTPPTKIFFVLLSLLLEKRC